MLPTTVQNVANEPSLPLELRDLVADQLDDSDVRNLALSARAFRRVSQTPFRKLSRKAAAVGLHYVPDPSPPSTASNASASIDAYATALGRGSYALEREVVLPAPNPHVYTAEGVLMTIVQKSDGKWRAKVSMPASSVRGSLAREWPEWDIPEELYLTSRSLYTMYTVLLYPQHGLAIFLFNGVGQTPSFHSETLLIAVHPLCLWTGQRLDGFYYPDHGTRIEAGHMPATPVTASTTTSNGSYLALNTFAYDAEGTMEGDHLLILDLKAKRSFFLSGPSCAAMAFVDARYAAFLVYEDLQEPSIHIADLDSLMPHNRLDDILLRLELPFALDTFQPLGLTGESIGRHARIGDRCGVRYKPSSVFADAPLATSGSSDHMAFLLPVVSEGPTGPEYVYDVLFFVRFDVLDRAIDEFVAGKLDLGTINAWSHWASQGGVRATLPLDRFCGANGSTSNVYADHEGLQWQDRHLGRLRDTLSHPQAARWGEISYDYEPYLKPALRFASVYTQLALADIELEWCSLYVYWPRPAEASYALGDTWERSGDVVIVRRSIPTTSQSPSWLRNYVSYKVYQLSQAAPTA